jgi:hypothetical protein
MSLPGADPTGYNADARRVPLGSLGKNYIVRLTSTVPGTTAAISRLLEVVVGMVESVTMSLAVGIIVVVVLVMALTRALRRRVPDGDATEAKPEESERDRLRSRKAS